MCPPGVAQRYLTHWNDILGMPDGPPSLCSDGYESYMFERGRAGRRAAGSPWRITGQGPCILRIARGVVLVFQDEDE